jgi:hypothetical protein
MIPKKDLIASVEAPKILAKWNGDKASAIKDVEGSIEAYGQIHPYNETEPPVEIKFLLDVKNEINKL